MSTTVVNSAHFLEKWARDVYREYIRESGFMPYMGASGRLPIVTKRDLTDAGKIVNVPFSPKLVGAGVTGAATLKGNEEAMSIFNEQVEVDYIRQAVEVTKRDGRFTNFDLAELAKSQVKDWFINRMRQRVIDQLLSIRASTAGTVANTLYGTVTVGSTGPVITAGNYLAAEADKDTWLVNNADRVLFGALRSNASSNDHSTSLGNVDTTADTMRASIVSLAKRMAKQANPVIRPIRVTESGDEYYVMFLPTRAFRDAQADATINAANRDARPRVVTDNPIFTGGELLYDGVILKEIPELPVLTAAGASSADVAPCFLVGAQALAYALGQDMTAITEEDDYGFRNGFGGEEVSGLKKIFYNGKQHGCVTVYVAAAADS